MNKRCCQISWHYDDGHDDHHDDHDHDYHCFDENFLEDDGCEPMKGPRSEPQMMSMHEEHKKIEVNIPLNWFVLIGPTNLYKKIKVVKVSQTC